MSGLASLIGLMLRALAGYVAALATGGVVFVVLVIAADPALPGSNDTLSDLGGGMLLFSLFVAATAGMLTAIPVFLAIVLSEWRGLNGLVFQAGVGAVIGLGAVTLWASRNFDGAGPALAGGVVAGAAGAAVYWLIAGQRAGETFARIVADRNARKAL